MGDGVPGGLRHAAIECAVGDQLDGVLLQQQVEHDAIVVLGVPDSKFGKQGQRPLARCGVFQRIVRGQAGFDAQDDLAGMLLFAGMDDAL